MKDAGTCVLPKTSSFGFSGNSNEVQMLYFVAMYRASGVL